MKEKTMKEKTMKEKHDISKVTMHIIVDHTTNETKVKQAGCKTNLSYIQSTCAAAYRGALRDAAFYLLDMASKTDGANCVRDQIRIMWSEHRAFNDKLLN